MPIWLRLIVLVVTILSILSLLWFLIGSTSYFQRGMDIIGTTYLILAGIPLLLLSILFVFLLAKGWTPTMGIHYIGICVGLVVSILLSAILIQGVISHGWTEETIYSDTLKSTTDGKYEYRIDLINLFQRNSKAQLYLKEVDTGEEKYIPVDIQTRTIIVLFRERVNHWVLLEPTDDSVRYILTTTKELRIPEEKFEIDIREGTSIRLQ